jgi:hypothetical protein
MEAKRKRKISKTKANNNVNVNENLNLNENLKAEFEKFRVSYIGTKRGLNEEFENFTNKNKDWNEIIPKLLPALQNQIKWRKAFKEVGKFVPEWKVLTTWINQKCWTEIHTKNELND